MLAGMPSHGAAQRKRRVDARHYALMHEQHLGRNHTFAAVLGAIVQSFKTSVAFGAKVCHVTDDRKSGASQRQGPAKPLCEVAEPTKTSWQVAQSGAGAPARRGIEETGDPSSRGEQ